MRFCINLKQPCDYVFFKFMDNTRSSITVVETYQKLIDFVNYYLQY
ncbi:unnamed protein product [Tenebrio molitor]|nr:unnamed protein product [Tenebrio molitor]